MNKTINLLQNNDNFLIITHKKPDGDTTGSAGALCNVLRKIGKTAFVLKNDDVTPKYGHLIENYYASEDFSPDFIITTDIASTDLFTDNASIYKDNIDLCIDHHVLSNNGFAKENLILDTAACGEIVFDIANLLDVNFDKELALALYYSVSTDTGCFKYPNTTAHTHLVAAKCLPFIKAGEINRVLFDMKTKARLEIEKRVLTNISFYFDEKVSLITISNKDKQETGATPDDLDSIAALPRSIEGVMVAITLTEQSNGDIKVSVRSSGDVSASDICRIYDGGGHLRAAGATFTGLTFEKVIEKMIFATQKVSNYV